MTSSSSSPISLSPDRLVEHIIEEIIVSYVCAAKVHDIWTIVCKRLKKQSISETYKLIIWSWLIKKPEIEIYVDDKLLPSEEIVDLNKLIESVGDVKRIVITIEQDKQWLFLTNKPKDGNTIGLLPFELLRYIASRKEKGISGAELARVADQDPRSFTSRFLVLEKEGLIKKKNADIPGITTSLLIHSKYYASGKESLPVIDWTGLRRKTVGIIKHSKNKIRTQKDVAMELGYTGSRLHEKKFRRLVSRLCQLEYLKPVLVAPLHRDPNQAKTRALMFIKDYDIEKLSDEEDEEDDDDDEEEEDDEEKTIVKQENLQDSSLLQQDNFDIMDIDTNNPMEDEVIPTMNMLFPIINQVSEVIRYSGSVGLSSMHIQETIADKSTLWFPRYLSDLKVGVLPGSEHLSNYSIVRILDSEGKAKFYRYFTQEEYSKLSGNEISANAGEFPNLDIKEDPSLFKIGFQYGKESSTMGLAVMTCQDGKERLFWSGSTDPIMRDLYQKKLKEDKDKDILTSTSFIDDTTDDVIATFKEKLTAAQVKKLAIGDTGSKKGKAPKRGSSETESAVSEKKQKTAVYKSRPSEDPVFFEPSKKFEHKKFPGVIETLPRASIVEPVEPIQRDTKPASPPVEVLLPQVATPDFNINFAGFAKFGGSLKSNQRRQVLLDILDENDGVIALDMLLSRLITEKMSSSYMVDKITLKKDSIWLQEKGYLKIIDFQVNEQVVKKLLVRLKNKPSATKIQNFIQNYKNSSSVKPTHDLESFNLPVEFRKIEAPKYFERKPRIRSLLTSTTRLSKATIKSESAPKEIKKKKIAESRPAKVQAKAPKKPSLEDIDPMLSYLSNLSDLKRKVLSRKNPSERKSGAPVLSHDRTKKNYDSSYIISVLKVYTVVTSLQLNKVVIDWKSIAGVLGDESTHETVRRRWTQFRKRLRYTLPRMKDAWDRFLTASIKNGKVTYEMLATSDFKSLYKLWDETEVDDFHEEMRLYAKYEDNLQTSSFTRQNVDPVNFTSLASSLEKERYLTHISFTRPIEPSTVEPPKHDKTKAVLRSIFATEAQDFNMKKSREILKSLDDYFLALKELEISKEVTYLGENSDVKFTIPEKTWLQFQQKINDKFLEGATMFLRAFSEVVDAKKGMALSVVTPDHTIAVVLHLALQGKIKLHLIDRVLKKKLAGYFTRTFNRLMLEADIVLTLGSDSNTWQELPAVPIPMEGPCSRIWVSMNGDLKSGLWKVIIATVINHIYFNPGTNLKSLNELTGSLLLLFELQEVINWLQAKKAITIANAGYHVTPYFYTVIG